MTELIEPPEPAIREMSGGELLAHMGTDGVRWAAAFMSVPNVMELMIRDGAAPGGFLHGWMCNAIEAGRSAGYAEGAPRSANLPGRHE